MKRLFTGLTYAYHRNIGWQDRVLRSAFGIIAFIGAVYFLKTNLVYSAILSGIAAAQLITVLSAKCIICYFTGTCTISFQEKQSLNSKGIEFEK